MKILYYIYQHPEVLANFGDGLAMVKRDNAGPILFYDHDHDVLFSNYEDLPGSIIHETSPLVPATLEDICESGLIGMVDTVLEMTRDQAGLIQSTYIHIRRRDAGDRTGVPGGEWEAT